MTLAVCGVTRVRNGRTLAESSSLREFLAPGRPDRRSGFFEGTHVNKKIKGNVPGYLKPSPMPQLPPKAPKTP